MIIFSYLCIANKIINNFKNKRVMATTRFSVLKKSAGYSIKSFSSEIKAREFAEICKKNNHTDDYIVCEYNNGMFNKI